MENLIKVNNFGVDFLDIYLPFPCDIHHCYQRSVNSSESFKVLLHACEPSPLKWSIDEVIKQHSYFDLILSSEKLLLNLPNVNFFIFGDCWVKEYLPTLKVNSISYLHSRGIDQNWDGYNFRKEIWGNRQELKLLNNFKLWYSSRRPPRDDIKDEDNKYDSPNKDILFESMFSICVENIREFDYFTEKIIDAFATYTVPIYYGCPNINDYFDKDGIIEVNSILELMELIPKLNEDFYLSKVESIRKNKILSEKFKNGVNNIQDMVSLAYFKKN
jgi:hypothetical protein